ncbi:MAG: KTSC domain-containing protein [Dehalococcoidia bacterium]|nr:KTSC domain-containing protein [Dehalococcoidia bacterium]
MQWVESSSIESVGYDATSRELYVRFLETGDTYVYHGVGRTAYDEFVAAESKGAYLNKQIKMRYSYDKLDKNPRVRRQGSRSM